MQTITRLFLFVHPLSRSATVRDHFWPRWEELFAAVGSNPAHALAIISIDLPGAAELNAMGERYFGDRCVVDPFDYSDATKILIADDLQRLLRGRGMRDEWQPQEIWSSYSSRRWSEGLKRTLGDRGYAMATEELQVVAAGREWGGCLTKYPMMMARYLGATQTPTIRTDLSPDVGFPYKVQLKEHIALDSHVGLYLFTTPGGRLCAHYMDGLRAIWEPPHTATINTNTAAIETVVAPLGRDTLMRSDAVTVYGDELRVDVQDGCRSARVTLFARDRDYDAFRNALASARIEPKRERAITNLSWMGGQNPITFADEG